MSRQLVAVSTNNFARNLFEAREQSSRFALAQVEGELGKPEFVPEPLQAMSRSPTRAAKCGATTLDGVLKALLTLPTQPTEAELI